MVTVTIHEGQRGLLYRNGVLTEWLRPGRHRRFNLFQRRWVEFVDRHEGTRRLEPGMERVVPADEVMFLDVPAGHAAAVTREEEPFQVLPPGRWVIWLFDTEIDIEIVELAPLRTEIPREHWKVAVWKLCGPLVEDVVVRPFERVLVYEDGELACQLETGRHGLSRWGREIELRRVDLRERELQVAGQELITSDKVSLRLNLMLRYRIVDAVQAQQAVDNLRDALYGEVQLTTRNAVAGATVDELLEQRESIARDMVAAVSRRAHNWGVEIRRLEIKDVILPGEMKVLLNQVIEAQKRAAAQAILRREETAATRSLANTARLLESNPVLQRLKEAETWREIAEKIPNLTVVIAPNELQGRLQLGKNN